MLSIMPIIFKVLIEKSYFSAYKYIPILVLASFFELFSILIGGIFIALKMPKEIAKTTIIGGFLNIIINFVFLKKYGVIVACISTLISYIYIAVIRYFKINKYVKIKLAHIKYGLIAVLYMIIVFLYYYQSCIVGLIGSILIFLLFIKLEYKNIYAFVKRM